MNIDPNEEILKVCQDLAKHEIDLAEFVKRKTVSNAELEYKKALAVAIETLMAESVPVTLIPKKAETVEGVRKARAKWRHQEIVLRAKQDIITSMQSRKRGYESINKVVG